MYKVWVSSCTHAHTHLHSRLPTIQVGDRIFKYLDQQEFVEADPVPSLLKIAKDYPSYKCIKFPIVEYYVDAWAHTVHFKDYFDQEVKIYRS